MRSYSKEACLFGNVVKQAGTGDKEVQRERGESEMGGKRERYVRYKNGRSKRKEGRAPARRAKPRDCPRNGLLIHVAGFRHTIRMKGGSDPGTNGRQFIPS